MTWLDKITWSLRHPLTSAKIQIERAIARLSPKKDILVYLGVNSGSSFDQLYRRYRRCYGFEANPEHYELLKKRYGHLPQVTIIHAAVSDQAGETEFHLTDDSNSGSSSMGQIDPEWNVGRQTPIQVRKTIRVPTINLLDFCKEEGIDVITDYFSDIQGMDLTVLKTMAPMIRDRRIQTITCEVCKDDKAIFPELPPNNLRYFQELLNPTYEMVASGLAPLKDGQHNPVPTSWWEYDCKWSARP